MKIKRRLFYNDYTNHNLLKTCFYVFILFVICFGVISFCVHYVQKQTCQISKVKIKNINVDEVIPPHPDIKPYESTMSMRKAVDTMLAEEKPLSKYLRGIYSESDKEKLFYRFITNLEYYTQVFSEQNAYRYHQNKHNSFYANSLKLKFHLNKTVDDIEVETVDDELKPPNIKSPNIKIYNPHIPFVKLVFESYFEGGKPSYYVLVPDYKYLSDKYSKYLSKSWLDYLNIKIKQQELLRNSIYRNDNGARFPYYISDDVVESWTNDFVRLLQANPNFIMYDDIVEQIVYDNYPNYDYLLKKVAKNTKLYTRLQQAKL